MRTIIFILLVFLSVAVTSEAETKIGRTPSEWLENLTGTEASWRYDEKGIFLYKLRPPLSLLVYNRHFNREGLWEALNDPHRFISVHILLTMLKYSNDNTPRNFEEWNGLPLVLHDGNVSFMDVDQKKIIDQWRDDLQ